MNFRGISHYSTTQTLDALYIIGGFNARREKFGKDILFQKNIVAEFKNYQWRRLANLNQGRHGHGSIAIGDQTIIIGGYFNFETLVLLFLDNRMTKNLLKSLLSTLVTEVWELENGNNTIIAPTLPDGHYNYGIALYVVDKDFCKK